MKSNYVNSYSFPRVYKTFRVSKTLSNPTREWDWRPEPPPKDTRESVETSSVDGFLHAENHSFRVSSTRYSDTGGGASQPSQALSMPSESKTNEDRISLIDLDRIERIAQMIKKHKEDNTSQNGDIRIPKRDVSQYAIPESKESAKAQLLALPPLELHSLSFKKLIREGTSSVSSSSPNLVAMKHIFKSTGLLHNDSREDPVELAKQLFDEQIEGFTKEMVSPMIGKHDEYHHEVLIAYVNNFDFTGISVDDAFRYNFIMKKIMC
jgi:hypothetical protein